MEPTVLGYRGIMVIGHLIFNSVRRHCRMQGEVLEDCMTVRPAAQCFNP